MKVSLQQDKRGVTWDLLLYVPTVFFLGMIATKFWYEGNDSAAYLLSFMASFFFFAGSNRILKTRLLLIGSAPLAIEAGKNSATITLKNGQQAILLKEVKRYGDYSGKTFGLSGRDGEGRVQQFVFHKGQFADPRDYDSIQKELDKLHAVTF